jgi:hypothetical protein
LSRKIKLRDTVRRLQVVGPTHVGQEDLDFTTALTRDAFTIFAEFRLADSLATLIAAGFSASRDLQSKDAALRYGRGAGVGRDLAVGATRGVGLGLGVAVAVGVAVTVAVAVGVGVALGCAQYLPPVSKKLPLYPPQTIISLPVQTAV